MSEIKNEITEEFLQLVSEYQKQFEGAYSIREDGKCIGARSTEHVKIVPKEDGNGIDIYISGQAKGEKVNIPACVTKSDVKDIVYNDFHVEEGADVTIIAGCGVHADEHGEALHNGIHRFFIGKGAHGLYKEKHIATGEGQKRIDPVTVLELEEDSVLEMDTLQIRGVDHSTRKTEGRLKARAKLIIHERIMTDAEETADTDFVVDMEGEDSGVDLISRSVAKGNSRQGYRSIIRGNVRCVGHSECDAILVGNGTVSAAPELVAGHIDAALIHEAAIGKIAGEQILKLCTLGLTEEEAEQKIIDGFLKN